MLTIAQIVVAITRSNQIIEETERTLHEPQNCSQSRGRKKP
jgi:hypothetical protein